MWSFLVEPTTFSIGVESARKVRTLCPGAKVLTLSEKQKDDDLYEIILSGASGDVLKSAGSAEMVRSVAVVACGGLNFERDALTRLLGRIPRQQDTQSSEIYSLSERDRKIVTLVAQGYSNGEIGERLKLSKFTVRNIVGDIRNKFGLRSRTELATFAVEHRIVSGTGKSSES